MLLLYKYDKNIKYMSNCRIHIVYLENYRILKIKSDSVSFVYSVTPHFYDFIDILNSNN
jgi:hypothetical protein